MPVVSGRPARLGWEMLIVLGLSLGQSAVYSALSLINKLTLDVELSAQVTTINTSTTPGRPWLDLSYQLAGTVFPLMPVALACYLLYVVNRPEEGPFRTMGLDFAKPGRDLALGGGMFMVIGAAGLGFYLFSRQLGVNTQVAPANLAAAWWSTPILLARAVMNGILEEVVMIGYLFTRWRQRGGSMLAVLVISALIRGSYHLYQGFGGFFGNVAMGLIFGAVYLKTRRVMPLVICHALLDIVAFVGYALLATRLSWL